MKIAISSELKLLPILRRAVSCQAREHGLSQAAGDALAQAIDEAAGNVIRFTYAGRPGLMLSLEIVAYPDRLEFVLEDAGPKGKAGLPCSPGGVHPGGSISRSLHAAVDSSGYDPAYPAGNRLKLVKFIPGKE